MPKTTVEMREERGTLINSANELIDRAAAEGRDMTPEEEANFDRAMDQADDQLAKIERLERSAKASASLTESQARRSRPLDDDDRGPDMTSPAAKAKTREAYRHWLRTGELSPELRHEIQRARELRDTIIGTDAKGGFLITPVAVSSDIVKLIEDQVYIRALCQAAGSVMTVTEAKKLGVRKMTAHMADADWTTEVQPVTEDTTMAFDRRDLEPYLLSKLAKVSIRALMLSADAEPLVNQDLAYKFGVTEEKAYLLGNGTGKPLGVFVASANGISVARDVAAATATTFTADNLIDMKYSLKAGYTANPSCAWILSREFVKRARKLKVSSTGGNDLEYVWQPGLTEGQPDRILDLPFNMSEYAPAIFTTGLYVAVLGAFRYYRIAQLQELFIQRLVELYAGSNEVGFIGRRWVDGAPVQEEAFARLKMA